MNRCVSCNRFKPWSQLRVWSFTPDNAFGPEVIEYVFLDCDPDERESAEEQFCHDAMEDLRP